MTNPKKRTWWVFRPLEVILMAIPLLFVASLHLSKAPIFYGLYAAGRAGECPLGESLRVEHNIIDLNETGSRIDTASSVDLRDEKAGLARWNTPEGVFWAPYNTSVPWLLAEQVSRFYGDGERRVRKGDVVLDCGANIGTFVWEALQAGASLVVAIEPSPRNVESLRRNYAKEIQEGRVIVYPKGVWHQEETLTFHVFDNSALDSIMMTARAEESKVPRTESIEVTTIDKLVAELHLDRVDFIKMDIEGAERNALEGSTETLSRFRPRMSIATENLPDDSVVLPALVTKLRSDYRRECGRCSLHADVTIAPDVFYFY
jgi:FkbM family methyltransferase